MPHSHRQEPDLAASLFRIGLMLGGLFLLASILLSPFPSNYNSNRTSCMSNLKQLGLVLTQYAQDNNEAFPPTVSATGQDWREAVFPYARAVGVYRCPDDKRGGSSDTPTNLPKSYGAVSLGPGADGKDRGAFGGPTEKPLTIMDFPDPARTLAVTEMRGWGGADWNMVSPAFQPSAGRRLYAHFPKHWFFERPAGKTNCLFVDGHIKSLLPEATLTPTNLWTRDSKPFTGPDLQNAQAILARAAQE